MIQTPKLAVTKEQVLAWRRDGFLVLDSFLDAETLELLRGAYDEIISRKVRAEGDTRLGDITRQVMHPSSADARFDDNAAVQTALQVSRQLLDAANVSRRFDMLIYKPAGHPHETPWHQDYAYETMPFAPAGTPIPPDSVQFWIPLDDVDNENGCMQFVPGHADTVLEHKVASGSPENKDRLLALVAPEKQVDLSTAVIAEIPAGGATLHGPGAVHYTGPNRSADRPRRAYIFNIGIA